MPTLRNIAKSGPIWTTETDIYLIFQLIGEMFKRLIPFLLTLLRMPEITNVNHQQRTDFSTRIKAGLSHFN